MTHDASMGRLYIYLHDMVDFYGNPCRLIYQVGNRHPIEKSARTVGAKGRVFPEALTQSALAGGAALFLQVKCMVRS